VATARAEKERRAVGEVDVDPGTAVSLRALRYIK
jgi:hypothetical protein